MSDHKQTSEKLERYQKLLDKDAAATYRSMDMTKTSIDLIGEAPYYYYHCFLGHFSDVETMLNAIDGDF